MFELLNPDDLQTLVELAAFAGIFGIGNSSSSSSTTKKINKTSKDVSAADYGDLDTEGGNAVDVTGVGAGANVELIDPGAMGVAEDAVATGGEIAKKALDQNTSVTRKAVDTVDEVAEQSVGVASKVAKGQAAETIKSFAGPVALLGAAWAAAKIWG